ncbi:creatininase family protein [Reyranella sp. CPCC 100927]|uniref:creatininase family protein n=1 Tax=Reyranella sp. CPCC 100927 TaxID=2599616 RepID=UPI0011B42F2C|nr:creatininase family protein [Reyranella sp. CPCC 100927]TWT13006.1 creatininase family protein [Reyranella sp. CPCC 100927]
MRIADMNWMQVEARVQRDDRCVLPIGSVEQHAYLSLCVDMILSEKVAVDAAEPLGVPVYPAVPFGLTPYFADFPGTVTLRLSTYVALIEDILESLYRSGFRRVVVVNGHGGNSPIQGFFKEWMVHRRDARIKLHNWWNAPKTWAKVLEIDPAASHASWMENFPWTRVPGVKPPEAAKPAVDMRRLQTANPAEVRALIGDGNFHGRYERPDDEVLALWQVAVAETRTIIEEDWP